MERNADNPYVYDQNFLQNLDATDTYSLFRSLHRINNVVVAICGAFLNGLLLFLILRRTRTSLRSYSRIVLFGVIADIYLLVVDFLFQTRVKMGQGTELLALTGIVAMLPYDMQCQSISFQANAAFLSATILVAQYYYRFRLVTTRTPPSNKDATIYFFCSVLMATVSGLTASYTFCNRAECKLNTNFASLWFRESPIPQLMVASSCDSTMFLYMAVSTSTVVGSYLTIVVLNRLTVIRIRHQSVQMSEKSAKLQASFSLTLIVQTVMPFFLSIAPMSGILIMSLTKVDTSQAGNLLMMTISWIPVFNPLLSLIVISPYRRYFIRFFTHFSVSPISNSDLQPRKPTTRVVSVFTIRQRRSTVP